MTTIKFDKKCVCGPEFVCIRIIDNCENLEVDGIVLAKKVQENGRLAFGKIENIGETAAKEYGLAEGDYVMFDRLSTFAHTAPVCLVRYNNIICKSNAEKTEYSPLRNMAFVDANFSRFAEVEGILVKDMDGKLNTGKIVATNFDDALNLPFNVGDTVVLTKGADVMECGNKTYHIYKHDMIIATIKD